MNFLMEINNKIMETKKCSKCGKIKNINEFYIKIYVKNEYHSCCKICKNKQIRVYRKNNPEKIKEWKRKWRLNNPTKVKEMKKKWNKNNPTKDNKRKIRWAKNNPEKQKEISRKSNRKRMLIPKNRLNSNISRSIRSSLKSNKNGNHWENLVDYTLQNLLIHLEKQFKRGMNWENMGKWHIDHIIPISLWNFNSYNDREFKQCWALANLQPLWASENLFKGNNV